MALARRVLRVHREERDRHKSRHLRRYELGTPGRDGRCHPSSHRRRDEADGRTDRFGNAGWGVWSRDRPDLFAEHFLFDRRVDRADEVRDAVQGRIRGAHSERGGRPARRDSRDDPHRRGSRHVGRDTTHQVALSGSDDAGSGTDRLGARGGHRYRGRPVPLHRQWDGPGGDAQHLGTGRRQ